LPHAKDSESCEELQRALCDLLFNIDLLFMPPPEFRRQLVHGIFENGVQPQSRAQPLGRRRGLIHQGGLIHHDGVAIDAVVLLRISVTSSIASDYPPADLPGRLSLAHEFIELQSRAPRLASTRKYDLLVRTP
jgi:hypothetical protein